ncbi:MAG: methyltransferase domain-containing protein [Oligoflexia bacterium]|nr:methyltransferase domain-containing protein [Oligoflexia bacterium]
MRLILNFSLFLTLFLSVNNKLYSNCDLAAVSENAHGNIVRVNHCLGMAHFFKKKNCDDLNDLNRDVREYQLDACKALYNVRNNIPISSGMNSFEKRLTKSINEALENGNFDSDFYSGVTDSRAAIKIGFVQSIKSIEKKGDNCSSVKYFKDICFAFKASGLNDRNDVLTSLSKHNCGIEIIPQTTISKLSPIEKIAQKLRSVSDIPVYLSDGCSVNLTHKTPTVFPSFFVGKDKLFYYTSKDKNFEFDISAFQDSAWNETMNRFNSCYAHILTKEPTKDSSFPSLLLKDNKLLYYNSISEFVTFSEDVENLQKSIIKGDTQLARINKNTCDQIQKNGGNILENVEKLFIPSRLCDFLSKKLLIKELTQLQITAGRLRPIQVEMAERLEERINERLYGRSKNNLRILEIGYGHPSMLAALNQKYNMSTDMEKHGIKIDLVGADVVSINKDWYSEGIDTKTTTEIKQQEKEKKEGIGKYVKGIKLIQIPTAEDRSYYEVFNKKLSELTQTNDKFDIIYAVDVLKKDEFTWGEFKSPVSDSAYLAFLHDLLAPGGEILIMNDFGTPALPSGIDSQLLPIKNSAIDAKNKLIGNEAALKAFEEGMEKTKKGKREFLTKEIGKNHDAKTTKEEVDKRMMELFGDGTQKNRGRYGVYNFSIFGKTALKEFDYTSDEE